MPFSINRRINGRQSITTALTSAACVLLFPFRLIYISSQLVITIAQSDDLGQSCSALYIGVGIIATYNTRHVGYFPTL